MMQSFLRRHIFLSICLGSVVAGHLLRFAILVHAEEPTDRDSLRAVLHETLTTCAKQSSFSSVALTQAMEKNTEIPGQSAYWDEIEEMFAKLKREELNRIGVCILEQSVSRIALSVESRQQAEEILTRTKATTTSDSQAFGRAVIELRLFASDESTEVPVASSNADATVEKTSSQQIAAVAAATPSVEQIEQVLELAEISLAGAKVATTRRGALLGTAVKKAEEVIALSSITAAISGGSEDAKKRVSLRSRAEKIKELAELQLRGGMEMGSSVVGSIKTEDGVARTQPVKVKNPTPALEALDNRSWQAQLKVISAEVVVLGVRSRTLSGEQAPPTRELKQELVRLRIAAQKLREQAGNDMSRVNQAELLISELDEIPIPGTRGDMPNPASRVVQVGQPVEGQEPSERPLRRGRSVTSDY